MKKYRLIHQNSNIEAPEGRLDIGRSVECYLVLDDPSVSRIHATIVNDGETLILEDRGSRNGCIVNGVRASGQQVLRDGDRISIGHQIIRIVALDRGFDAERTMGLIACKSCGSWMSTGDPRCPHCGALSGDAQGLDARKTMKPEESRQSRSSGGLFKTQQPQMMLAGLIKKAISMDKFEEAERMLKNLIESTLRREKSSDPVPDNEIEDIAAMTLSLAEATRNPRHISNLFSFYNASGRLMSRETTESLYEKVRKVGYRSCPEMSGYLQTLAARAGTFSPGERFIHRRLEGLVGVCS